MTMDYERKLPFFPKYEEDCICHEKLRVIWFELDFSQSRYNSEKKIVGSNACTIIVLLVAAICCRELIPLHGPKQEISYYLIRALGRAMVNGNATYAKLKHQGVLQDLNLTIPEAIRYAGKHVSGIKEWKSVLYMQSLLQSLHKSLLTQLEAWKNSVHQKKHPDLYIVLICDSKSILFIINENQNTVTLIDSHQHSTTKGSLIATVDSENLRCLSDWLTHIILKYYRTDPKLYELSLLYFRRRKPKH